jgi:hypothetical protein
LEVDRLDPEQVVLSETMVGLEILPTQLLKVALVQVFPL